MQLPIKKLNPDAKLPTRGSADSAGLDLYALGSTRIASGARVAVPTGIAASIPHGHVGMLFIRSGHALKHGLSLANGTGVVDADYRGEIMAVVHNTGMQPYTIHDGERFCQLVIQEYVHALVVETYSMSGTDRGGAGFGSTGQ
ncbi:dUTP diphosphatase [Auritidibacter ignavus]|uniref:dUTP diphosphatase n=1 Tax=Auritidibacter ignavus TaxID=678932 RepID=UPI000F0278DF|nr:dUTP pyrophosphatase [Auritidibacter ignavus]RMX23747.1 dUTP diphosphatase [Auritidibacter ignavus]